MNTRVKELRKTLGLTMEKFGSRLGVTKVAISNIENGNRNVTEQMLKSICREFNVNESWLRSGTGEMFLSTDNFTIDEFIKSKDASALEIEILKLYFDIKPEIRHELVQHFINGLDTIKESNPEMFIPDDESLLSKDYPDSSDSSKSAG